VSDADLIPPAVPSDSPRVPPKPPLIPIPANDSPQPDLIPSADIESEAPEDSTLEAEEESEEELWAAFAASYGSPAKAEDLEPDDDAALDAEDEGPDEAAERVSKLIARLGIASRRAAEDIIKEGRVSVNGHFVTEPGIKANPLRDTILVDGRQIKIASRPTQVLIVHKPRNVMTTHDDPGRRTTVFNLVPRKYEKFHTVGRLDFDTSGVLLLTDDGSLTHLLTHPSHGAEKTYEARVRGQVTESDLERLMQGLMLDDGPTAPCRARLVAQREKNALVEIRIREGRNRQVRRMFEAIGHPVSGLRRVAFAGVELEGLPPGGYRVLLPGEVSQLRKRLSGKIKKQKALKPRPSRSAPKTASVAPLPPRPAAGKVVKARAAKPDSAKPTLSELAPDPVEFGAGGVESREARFFGDDAPRFPRANAGRGEARGTGPDRGAPSKADGPKKDGRKSDRPRPDDAKKPARDPKAGLGKYIRDAGASVPRSKDVRSAEFKPFDSRPRQAGGRPAGGRTDGGRTDGGRTEGGRTEGGRNGKNARDPQADRRNRREGSRFNPEDEKGTGAPQMRKPSHIKPLRTNPEPQPPRSAKPEEGYSKTGPKKPRPAKAGPPKSAAAKPKRQGPAPKSGEAPKPRKSSGPTDQSATARRIEKRWKD